MHRNPGIWAQPLHTVAAVHPPPASGSMGSQCRHDGVTQNKILWRLYLSSCPSLTGVNSGHSRDRTIAVRNVIDSGHFDGLSNKCSNKKSSIRKALLISILQIHTIALLRRWLRVQVLVNPVSLFQLVFPWPRPLRGQL